MESNQVLDMVGTEVWYAKGDCMADIMAYDKGWVKIGTDDGEIHKVRAKDLTPMDSEEELVETEEGLTTQPEDPSEASSEVALPFEAGTEIDCGCGLTFEAPRTETFQCPSCNAWHRVRLHPNLNDYVTGLDATASGRDTVDINDSVANELRGMDLDGLYDFICKKLSEEVYPEAMFSKAMGKAFTESSLSCVDFLMDRYAERNPGMQRMNLGNLLRGAYKRHNVMVDKENAVKEAATDGES